MPTRPGTPDPSGSTSDHSAFGGLGGGLNFFQDWLKAAGSALPHLAGKQSAPGMPAWSMPTLDPEELDKRIQDLKTVQFWLEQNARMIAMTIQGLEVQRMTLSTLKGMNVSVDALREKLMARVPDTPVTPPEASTPDSAQPSPPSEASESAGADMVNPMQWWNTLTQQFSHLATQATQTAQSVGESVGASMTDMMAKAQAATAAAAQSASEPAATSASAKKSPASKTGRKTASKPASKAAAPRPRASKR